MNTKIHLILAAILTTIASCDRSNAPDAAPDSDISGSIIGLWSREAMDDIQGHEVHYNDTVRFSIDSVWCSKTSFGGTNGAYRDEYSGTYLRKRDTLLIDLLPSSGNSSNPGLFLSNEYKIVRLDAGALVVSDGVYETGFNRINK